MRNGTIALKLILEVNLEFFILPMRNGNGIDAGVILSKKISSSYPTMRMETRFNCFCVFSSFVLVSYPWGMETRACQGCLRNIQSSYPTYEEWKRWEPVPTPYSGFGFLSYLWGMETIVFKMYCCKIFILVLTSINEEETWSYNQQEPLCSYPTMRITKRRV